MGNNRYLERLPAHCCGTCGHVVFEGEDCPECHERHPGGGWEAIEEGFDRWLGRVFDGRYLVTRCIGQGATGAVYRATSLAITRDFAIKVLNLKEGAAGIDGDQTRARLHREIEAIGRLRNPHVVPFYEVIELYDAYVGVVMDYIRGTTLDQLVERRGPLGFERASAILRQVANGVHEAHEAGMIHRDLKPDNIMVERMPAGDDFAHILDFGIVRVDDGVSMTRGFLGTPLYASPEQAMAGAVDRRSDIYSLGAVLFFMLTGRPPFESENVYEILQAHVRRQAPTLAQANPSRSYPPQLQELVGQMLAKSPLQRPDTLAAVIARLDAMRRDGVLAEITDSSATIDAPDSLEFEVFTGPERSAPRTPAHFGPHELAESSSSMFESREHDDTGPKAAIYRRPMRTGQNAAIAADPNPTVDSRVEKILEERSVAEVFDVSTSGRARSIAVATDGAVVVHDEGGAVMLARGGVTSRLDAVADVCALAISRSAVCAGTRDGSVIELSSRGWQRLFQSPTHDALSALALDDRDRTWLAATANGCLYRCAPAAARDVWIRLQSGRAISALAIGPGGDAFAVARGRGEIEVCSLANPTKPYARFDVGGRARSLAFSPDGHVLAVILEDDSIAVHLVEGGGRRVHSVRDPENRILALRFTRRELLGYFERDQKLCVRYLDRERAQ